MRNFLLGSGQITRFIVTPLGRPSNNLQVSPILARFSGRRSKNLQVSPTHLLSTLPSYPETTPTRTAPSAASRAKSLEYPRIVFTFARTSHQSSPKQFHISIMKILFVCHGNICRSPMAEFILKALVRARGLDDQYHIESAAVATEEIGNPSYPPAKRCLRQHGVPFDEGKRARQVRPEDSNHPRRPSGQNPSADVLYRDRARRRRPMVHGGFRTDFPGPARRMRSHALN